MHFSTQPQCYLTFSWTDLQALLRCYLIHVSIIMLRHFWYLLYLCSCLDLGLFMSFMCDLLLTFIFVSLWLINRIISWKHPLFFCFLEYVLLFKMITWMKNGNKFEIVKVRPQNVAYHLLDSLLISAWCCL